MNVLIIGGTRFVGRHIAAHSFERGHDVTLFHRGQTNAPALNAFTHVYGDRNHDLARLGDRTWDAVIDTCAYTPNETEIAARYFAKRTRAYAFISTISVYDYEKSDRPTEDSPLVSLPPGADRTRMVPETYGALKALCERIVTSTFRHRAIVLRPGLVAGPFDPTDRFTYWPLRVKAGGAMLAPESPETPLQYIDARDLADFTVTLVENGGGGTYNAVTTPGSKTFGELFDCSMRASGVGVPEIRYACAEFLLENGVSSWSDMPLWIPKADPAHALIMASNARARVQGLHTRLMLDTVADTLAWANREKKRLFALKAGLSPAREAELLRKHDTGTDAVK